LDKQPTQWNEDRTFRTWNVSRLPNDSLRELSRYVRFSGSAGQMGRRWYRTSRRYNFSVEGGMRNIN
jgi:hypothetical protein